MKKIFLVSFLAIISAACFAQVRGISNPLKFQANKTETSISKQSAALNFNRGNTGAINAYSPTLYFGMDKPSPKTTEEKITPPAVAQIKSQEIKKQEKPIDRQPENTKIAKEESTASGLMEAAQPITTPVTTSERDVQMSAPAIGKELGEEYISNLPKYKALIIGVSNYKFAGKGLESLENPTKDAKHLYQTLTENYTFDSTDVIFLADPTRHQIIDQLELLASNVGPKDNLLIFYAGHGYYDKQKELGYWLPSDATTTSKADWIANSTVKDYLRAINSKHTLLVTDACFGGSIFKTRSVDAYSIVRIHDLYKDPSRKAITSGNLTEVPDKSLFLSQLLKKLNDNEDDFLPAQNLFTRIYEPVINNSPTIPKFGVIQGAGDEGGDFIFIRRPKN